MNDLAQDQKNFRKLRKTLRQIEHLSLLQRNLNQEEKTKISKRSLFREKLKQLFEKYPNGELLAYDSRDNTFETEESMILSQNTSLIREDSPGIQHLSDKLNEISLDEKNVEIESNFVPYSEKSIAEHNGSSKETTIESVFQKETEISDKAKVESVPEDSKEKDRIKSLKIFPSIKGKKPNVNFDSITVLDAHQDLVTCVDIDGKSGLVATGSRDTSIKIWKFSDKEKFCELSKTFGEHSSIVTQVKFWDSNNYKTILENLKLNKDENEDLIDSLVELKDELPLVISSSLDCSIRFWSVSLLKCIKELYLYNPIKSFDTKNSFLIVGQDAGKIQLWKNFKEVKVLKSFEDTDNVVCIKFMENNKIYSLSQNGIFKIFTYTDQNLEEILNIDVLEKVQEESTGDMKRNFKQFEALDMNNLVFLNDNQSYIIELNLKNNNSGFLSTNPSPYAFSSVFVRHLNSNLVFVSSFNIDNAESVINVFKISNKLEYSYSIEDLDQDLSISTVSSSDMPLKEICVSIGAGTTLKIFFLSNSDDVLVPPRSNKVKILKMMRKFEIKNQSFFDSNDETDQEDNENETKDQTETQIKKSTCSIQ